MKFLSTLAALAISGASAAPGSHDAQLLQRAAKDVTGPYVESTAPVDNIFAALTGKEMTAVAKFVNKQVNHTIPGALSFSDGYGTMLLPPNKTEATAYLDKKGPKPKRYARIMGNAECWKREYMVGPLPVDDSTKAVPLDWATGGNATRDTDCGDEMTSTQASNPQHLRLGTESIVKRRSEKIRRDPHDPYEEKQKWDGTELPNDDKAPPVTILPDGARHGFDPKQNYVSWMDYTFFIATGEAGISLHDVRFKGERVFYELAMQEALAHYAGPDQTITEASYLDVSIGFNNFNLIPGYDCPTYATYTKAFCLFEYPMDFPLSRHSGEYFHATKNIAFMLRSISTVGNYDYQTTYEFHYDGSIQVVVRASGYIQGSDNVNATDAFDYGFHIRDGLSGAMHDHVLNFKADLDIKGTKNSLQKTEFVPHSQVYPWSKGKTINTMKVDRSFVTSEDDGKMNWAANAAAALAVVNKDKENEFGEYPGFRIQPSTGSQIHLTVENSTVFPDRVNWASHQLYALQRKDSEPLSAHPDNGNDGSGKPIVDFNDFFDGESLEQEDLVLYFNLGMHHMPDTYDLPVTVFQGAQSGIMFRPQNYQRSNNAQSTRQQVHITGDDNGKPKVNNYGRKDLSGSYDLKSANPSNLKAPSWS